MTSYRIVVSILVAGIILIGVYLFLTGDSRLWGSLVASVFGMCLTIFIVYLIIERRLKEERRARFGLVEKDVIDGALAHSIAIIRWIRMFAGFDDLVPKPNENNIKVN